MEVHMLVGHAEVLLHGNVFDYFGLLIAVLTVVQMVWSWFTGR
jgi:hypothetical protein